MRGQGLALAGGGRHASARACEAGGMPKKGSWHAAGGLQRGTCAGQVWDNVHLPDLVKLVVGPKRGSWCGRLAAEVAAAHMGCTDEQVSWLWWSWARVAVLEPAVHVLQAQVIRMRSACKLWCGSGHRCSWAVWLLLQADVGVIALLVHWCYQE